MANEYAIHRVDGRGASLDNMRFRDTVRFEIRFSGDTSVIAYWSHTHFTDQLSPRQINGLRLGCARALPKYQAYFDKHGKRFEVEEREKRDADRAIKKKADRIKWLESAIPRYQEELAALKGS